MDHSSKLIIFTRLPRPGNTKTRLIPDLGPEGAAQLQQQMTEHTVRQARKTDIPTEIRYTGGTELQMRKWLGDGLDYAEQGDGNLGERMQRTFEEHFSKGAGRVVIAGSDCPANGWNNMREAFRALESNDCVIGPASDGGYYLIGLCRAGSSNPPPRSRTSATLFEGIDWGGEDVFNQTMKAAASLSVHQLQMLHDVDLPEDIPPRISVIIPTLNEERHLARALEQVKGGFNVEVIVVDGGSTDGTRAIVPDCLACTAGRAEQQNMGAKAASGELLFFLHADTILPECWDGVVRKTLSDPAVALGAFSFRLDVDFRGKKFIEDTANWRSKMGGLPFGDQGLFMRREVFDTAGGFPELPIMEDYVLVRSVRDLGKVVTVPEAAITSGRRWQQHGVFKVTMINKLMILGFHLGIPPSKLASFYRNR